MAKERETTQRPVQITLTPEEEGQLIQLYKRCDKALTSCGKIYQTQKKVISKQESRLALSEAEVKRLRKAKAKAELFGGTSAMVMLVLGAVAGIAVAK